MSNETQYPKYRPLPTSSAAYLTYSYDDLNKEAEFDYCEMGAQASFVRNNARSMHKDEYALKLYNYRWEAVCAYARQKLAGQYFCAPPVGKMVKVVDSRKRVIYWGYQTCVAIKLEKDFKMYHKLFPNEESRWKGPTKLRRLMRGISIASIVSNDLSDDGMRSKTPIKGRKGQCLGGDLHDNNVMIWEDEFGERAVCIDFGMHCVLTSSRGEIKCALDRDDI